MLRSEWNRALLLLIFFALMAPVLLGATLFRNDLLVWATGNENLRHLAPAFWLICTIFQTWMLLYFGRLLKTGGTPAWWVLPISTVCETMLPTLVLIGLTQSVSPLDAISAPPFLFYFVLIVLSPLRMDVKLCLLTGVASGIGYLCVALPQVPLIAASDPTSIYARWMPHVARSNLILLTGVIAAFVTHSIRKRQRRTLQIISERQRVVDLFGQHVSQAVVDKLLEQDSELPSETRQVCVLFFDIRSFTTFSESHTPDEVVEFLNTLFEPLVDVVNQHQGIINKFLGDGFMAVFGAPIDDNTVELNATRASLKILAAVDDLREAGKIPDMGVGIGLHAGSAMTGNVGSRERKEYTIIGDTVNLAARIESLNKQFGAQLLVSHTVWLAVKDTLESEVEAEAQEPVQVKGRNEPVVIWKLR